MEILISILALTLAGGVVGLASLLNLSNDLPKRLRIKDSPARAAITLLVFVPLFILTFSAIFGGLFALAEGWDFKEGFEFLVQTICGLATPLTERVPEHSIGQVIALLFAIASLGVTSVIIGIVGQIALCNHLVDAIETNVATWIPCGQENSKNKVRPTEEAESKQVVSSLMRNNFTGEGRDPVSGFTRPDPGERQHPDNTLVEDMDQTPRETWRNSRETLSRSSSGSLL